MFTVISLPEDRKSLGGVPLSEIPAGSSRACCRFPAENSENSQRGRHPFMLEETISLLTREKFAAVREFA
jgi:hypothetical protein